MRGKCGRRVSDDWHKENRRGLRRRRFAREGDSRGNGFCEPRTTRVRSTLRRRGVAPVRAWTSQRIMAGIVPETSCARARVDVTSSQGPALNACLSRPYARGRHKRVYRRVGKVLVAPVRAWTSLDIRQNLKYRSTP